MQCIMGYRQSFIFVLILRVVFLVHTGKSAYNLTQLVICSIVTEARTGSIQTFL